MLVSREWYHEADRAVETAHASDLEKVPPLERTSAAGVKTTGGTKYNNIPHSLHTAGACMHAHLQAVRRNHTNDVLLNI